VRSFNGDGVAEGADGLAGGDFFVGGMAESAFFHDDGNGRGELEELLPILGHNLLVRGLAGFEGSDGGLLKVVAGVVFFVVGLPRGVE